MNPLNLEMFSPASMRKGACIVARPAQMSANLRSQLDVAHDTARQVAIPEHRTCAVRALLPSVHDGSGGPSPFTHAARSTPSGERTANRTATARATPVMTVPPSG